MRIVLTIVTMCALFGAAAVVDPNRVHLIVQWSLHSRPAPAYLLLVLEPLVIAGLAILAAKLRQWMLPILAFAALGTVWAGAPLEFGALLLALAIMSWPPTRVLRLSNRAPRRAVPFESLRARKAPPPRMRIPAS